MVTARLPHGRSGSRGVAEATALQCRFHARVSHKVVWERLLGARASGHQTVERDESAAVSHARSRRWAFLEPTLNGSRGSSAVYTTASHERDSELCVR